MAQGNIELHQKLNDAGYNLAVDGKFGNKTLEAVKDYQNANGLMPMELSVKRLVEN